ncbi:MAG: acyl carrier protein [Clostridia bacterium]|jgi:acyl carrier protein|nr:acyl carrier protein [Clostridia bacterium]MBR2644519.1 acyl carrier protein [Clostridia bacterium]MBR3038952.1 acyl carrier protein [Clostridia bacterium]MBR3130432.1 acyl carrier protein [Clostridia bacterium]
MNRQEIFEKLKEIAELTVQDPAVLANMNEDSDLSTDLGLSSVGMLYIVIAIEEMFYIRMDDVSFGDFRTVRDVVDYIEKKIAE